MRMLGGMSALGTLAMVSMLCWMLARMWNVLCGLALSESRTLGELLMLEETPRMLRGMLEGTLSKSWTLQGALAESETLGVCTGSGVLRRLPTASQPLGDTAQMLGELAWTESWTMRGVLTSACPLTGLAITLTVPRTLEHGLHVNGTLGISRGL